MTKVVTTTNDGTINCAVEICTLLSECGAASGGVTVGESVDRQATNAELTAASSQKLPVLFKDASGDLAVVKGNGTVKVIGVAKTTSEPTQTDITNALHVPVFFDFNSSTGSFKIALPDGTFYQVTPCSVTHDNTLTGNGTSANPLGVNPNAFVGIAQTTAPTQAQKDAAVKVATFFNFNCTGGTNGKPIFDIIKPDGSLCTIDVGAS